MNAFDRYAPFIQDFIYSHDWESLRSIQVAAADAIFNTQDNVLLTEDGCVLISKRQTALIEIPYRTGEEA